MSIVGLDVGGTTLKAIKIAGQNHIVARKMLSGGGGINRDDLIRRIVDCVAEFSSDDLPKTLGLCFGGMIQADGTMREGSTNLPNLAGVPLETFFSDRLGLPCRVENDAMAAMRGEAALGAARGLRHAMTLTFGSGIGSGLLLDGRIRCGAHGRAGEIGVWRMSPQGSEPEWPSLEDIAAPARFAARKEVEFAEMLKQAKHDCQARSHVEVVFEMIGRAIANAHLLLDLEAVILMGGVTALGETFRKAVEDSYRAACPAEFQYGLQIKFSALGPYAGAVGAAALWFEGAGT